MVGHKHYATVTYVPNRPLRLPRFFGGLNPDGCGVVVFRYGGSAQRVIVYRRVLCIGWSVFVQRARLRSGCKLLMCHSFGKEISILRFKRGVGRSCTWDFNAEAQVLTRLIERGALPADVDSEVRRTSICPYYMSSLLRCPSGIRVFKMYDHFCMKIPDNVANYVEHLNEVIVRNGQRIWFVSISLGYFRGPQWTALVGDCHLIPGYSLYFFVNRLRQLEMIVTGDEGAEVVFEWARDTTKLYERW